jgi:hypothetical protein
MKCSVSSSYSYGGPSLWVGTGTPSATDAGRLGSSDSPSPPSLTQSSRDAGQVIISMWFELQLANCQCMKATDSCSFNGLPSQLPQHYMHTCIYF